MRQRRLSHTSLGARIAARPGTPALPRPGRHDLVRGNRQSERGSDHTGRNYLPRPNCPQMNESELCSELVTVGAITEDQDHTSYFTGVALRPRRPDLVGFGGRDGQSGLHLFDTRPRSICPHAGADDSSLSIRRPAVGGCRVFNYRGVKTDLRCSVHD